MHILQFYKCILGHFIQVPSWVELNDMLPQVLSTLSFITHLPPKLPSSVCWLSPITTLFPYHHLKMWRIHGKQTKLGEIRQGGGNLYCWVERNGRTAVRWGRGSFVPSACGICLFKYQNARQRRPLGWVSKTRAQIIPEHAIHSSSLWRWREHFYHGNDRRHVYKFVPYKFTYLSRTESYEINCYSYPVQGSLINSSAVINARPQMCTSFPEPHHMPDQ